MYWKCTRIKYGALAGQGDDEVEKQRRAVLEKYRLWNCCFGGEDESTLSSNLAQCLELPTCSSINGEIAEYC